MANRVAMMEEDITESEAVAIMAAAVSTTPTTPKTVVVKEDETHHPYAFHVSGPRNVASPNWRDLINSSW